MKLRTIKTGLCAGLLLLAGTAEAAEVAPPLHTAAGFYFACTNRDTPAMIRVLRRRNYHPSALVQPRAE